jgi:hypothetical protein
MSCSLGVRPYAMEGEDRGWGERDDDGGDKDREREKERERDDVRGRGSVREM